MVIEDEYFEIMRGNTNFKGRYVEIKDFRELSISEPSVTNIYDEQKNIVNRLKCQKAVKANTIIIYHNSEENEYKLKTRLREKKEYITKKPHAIVQKFWDERYNELIKFVNAQISKMDLDAPTEIKELDGNLFVDEDLSIVVRKNYDQTLSQLKELKLALEKTQYLSLIHI